MSGAEAIPYIMAAVGTAAQMKATGDAADERRSILNNQLSRDEEAAKKSSQLVLDESGKFAPEERKEALASNEEKLFGQQQKDLEAGAGGGALGAVDTSGGAGNVSDDFVRAKADRAVTEGNRLTSIARELAKTRAPGQMQIDEGYSRGNLASELQNLQGSNQNFARAAGNDASNVQESNLGSYGKIATAVGSTMVNNYVNADKYPVSKLPAGAAFNSGSGGIGFKSGGQIGFQAPRS